MVPATSAATALDRYSAPESAPRSVMTDRLRNVWPTATPSVRREVNFASAILSSAQRVLLELLTTGQASLVTAERLYMSNTQITVHRWSQDNNVPEVSSYVLTADGTWTKTGSDSGATTYTLKEIMFVGPGDAFHVTTDEPVPAPEVLAAALPQLPEYMDDVFEIETGDEVLDEFLNTGLRQVAINGHRWGMFPVNSDQADGVVWLEWDPDELYSGRPVPLGHQIAYAYGSEGASMTSGDDSWSLLDIAGNFVCFVAQPDSEEKQYFVEHRRGRTNRDLADDFHAWVDWHPVSMAVARAIEDGGEYSGSAYELDSDWSESLSVHAEVDLSITEQGDTAGE